MSLSGYGRYGLDDEAFKGRASVAWQRASGAGARLSYFRSYRDAHDEPESSPVRNSLAAQEFGSDYTEPFEARGAMLALDAGRRLGALWSLEGGWERQGPLMVHARPSNGRYEPTIPARALRGPRLRLSAVRPTVGAALGLELSGRAELRAGQSTPLDDDRGDRSALRRGFVRGFALVHAERPFGAGRLVLETTAAGLTNGGARQPQDYVYLGGPTSAPGYAFSSLAARFGATQHAEWRRPIPFVSLPLGRFGSTGRSATLAPFVHTAFVARTEPSAAGPAAGAGWYPSAGVGLLMIYDLLRLDVARGLRDGRWTFGIDVARTFWGIL